MRSVLPAVVLAVVVPACAGDGAQGRAHVGGCVAPGAAQDAFELTLGRAVTLPAPCADDPLMHFASPIRLTANDDGLRLQFDVADPSFASGGAHERARARDLATVFPDGEGPGKATIDLAVDPIAGGYRVDDTVPWEAWGLRQASGAFHLVCVLTDHAADGSEVALRIAVHARVRAGD